MAHPLLLLYGQTHFIPVGGQKTNGVNLAAQFEIALAKGDELAGSEDSVSANAKREIHELPNRPFQKEVLRNRCVVVLWLK
jgi:hypothetical protein